MQRVHSLIPRFLLAALFAVITTHVHAIVVNVDAKSAPWLVSLNLSFSFGSSGALAPTVVSNVDIPFAPGDQLQLTATGFASAAPPSYPLVDANGTLVQPGNDPNAYVGPVNDGLGNSGNNFPSKWMGPYPPDINLMELVGTFTDSQGTIVGQPFFVGTSRILTVPIGAVQLQLGVNDDIYGDNGGAFTVSILAVPEAQTMALMVVGLGLVAVAAKGRRVAAAV